MKFLFINVGFFISAILSFVVIAEPSNPIVFDKENYGDSAAPLNSYPQVPTFNCSAKLNPVEQLICNDPKLGLIDQLFADLYGIVQREMTVEERSDLIKSQLEWLKRRNKCVSAECIVHEYDVRSYELEHGKYIRPSRSRLIGLITLAYPKYIFPEDKNINTNRQGLGGGISIGQTKIYDSSKESVEVCSNFLSPSNISWHKNGDLDQYNIILGNNNKISNWTYLTSGVAYNKLDFFNDGVNRNVISVHLANVHFESSFFIVASSDEFEEIKNRLLNEQEADEWYQSLINDLAQFNYSKKEPVFSVATKNNKAIPKYKSLYVNASNTPEYQRNYTGFLEFTFNGKVYLAAELINNLGDAPSISIFKLKNTGELVSLCSHKAPPSTFQDVVDQQNEVQKCPENMKSSLSILPVSEKNNYETTLNLSEWGGSRVVNVRSEIWGQALTIGKLGVSKVDLNSGNYWVEKPYGGSEDIVKNNGQIFLSEYFGSPVREDSPPEGTQYYRIVNNSFVKACFVSKKNIPPKGYKILN